MKPIWIMVAIALIVVATYLANDYESTQINRSPAVLEVGEE